jgi:hypothetical protein
MVSLLSLPMRLYRHMVSETFDLGKNQGARARRVLFVCPKQEAETGELLAKIKMIVGELSI